MWLNRAQPNVPAMPEAEPAPRSGCRRTKHWRCWQTCMSGTGCRRHMRSTRLRIAHNRAPGRVGIIHDAAVAPAIQPIRRLALHFDVGADSGRLVWRNVWEKDSYVLRPSAVSRVQEQGRRRRPSIAADSHARIALCLLKNFRDVDRRPPGGCLHKHTRRAIRCRSAHLHKSWLTDRHLVNHPPASARATAPRD